MRKAWWEIGAWLCAYTCALLKNECLLDSREIFTLSLYIGNRGTARLAYLGLLELPNSLPDDIGFRHLVRTFTIHTCLA
jgi:hypothetical protein